jgi:long-chain acyl-CoA synthetase
MPLPETIPELFRDAARRFDRPIVLASKRDGEWVPISHKQLVERVRHLTAGFFDLGIRKGDRIAVVSESRPEWTITDLATVGLGGALVPIYPTLTPDHVEHILADSGARACVVSDGTQLSKVLPLLPRLEALEFVVVIDPAEWSPDDPVMSMHELEARGLRRLDIEADLPERLADDIRPEDLATLIYTSGTTGKQKGVMLTHRNFVSNIHATFETALRLDPSDVALSYLPLSHILERTATYAYLNVGASLYYASSFDKVAAEFREVRPTVGTSVPRFFEKMYETICGLGKKAGGVKSMIFERALRAGDHVARTTHAGESPSPLVQLEYNCVSNRLVFDKWRDALGGRLRFFLSGGAPLSPDIAYAFLGAGITIYEGYGLTETSPVIAINNADAWRIGTVGKPLSNVSVRLAEDGEILVSGPSIMQGYYNLPHATSEAFTEDGYFRTGDIGVLDADGFLKITDRKKDLLKTSGGKYVAPQPIENSLKFSNLIAQAVVIGDRRKYCSALIVPNREALGPVLLSKGIVLDDRESVMSDPRVMEIYEQVVRDLTGHLPRYEQIKKIAFLPNELTIESGELTPTLKVKRRVVEERYGDVIESLYADAEAKGTSSGA